MTNTTSAPTDQRPETKPAAIGEPPPASKTGPGPEATPPPPEPEPELESRIKLRRAEIIAHLGVLAAAASLEATEAADRLKARLSEVAHIIKEGVVDGWANLADAAKHKLEHWLTETALQLPPLAAATRTGQS